MEEEAPNQKRRKIHDSLNPTVLNQRQKNGKRKPKSKNKTNPSYPKPEGPKLKAIKWKKKTQFKKQKNPLQPKPDKVKPKALKWKKKPQIKKQKKSIIP